MKKRYRHLGALGANPDHFDRSQIKFFCYLIPVTIRICILIRDYDGITAIVYGI